MTVGDIHQKLLERLEAVRAEREDYDAKRPNGAESVEDSRTEAALEATEGEIRDLLALVETGQRRSFDIRVTFDASETGGELPTPDKLESILEYSTVRDALGEASDCGVRLELLPDPTATPLAKAAEESLRLAKITSAPLTPSKEATPVYLVRDQAGHAAGVYFTLERVKAYVEDWLRAAGMTDAAGQPVYYIVEIQEVAEAMEDDASHQVMVSRDGREPTCDYLIYSLSLRM